METSHEKQSYEYSKSGLTVYVSSPAIDTIQSISNKVDRASEVGDKRLAALYDVQAVQALSGLDKKINNTVNGISEKDDKGNDGKKVSDISLNVSLGSTSKTQNSTNDTRQAKGSQISAGKNLDIIATGTNKDDGNVTIQGSTVTGDKVHIQAVKDVTIESAENQTSNNTQTDGKSSGIGAQISAKGVGFYAEASKNKELENGTILTHTPSVVTAKDTLKIEAGHDVNILGSKASGDRVEVNVGNDLNLASQQDIDNYNEKSSSSGGKIGTAGIGLQGNASKGKIDSNYESVTTQAEIHAGQGGFNIEVGKNTDLKGAVISSDATPDKNKLSTDTLSYSDIKNKADYSASSIGVNYATGKDVAKKDQGLTPNIGVPAKGDASSTTKSAIANGTVEVRRNPNQDLSGLSRDTKKALNELGKIFDKKTVQERQELTKIFGEVAYNLVGELSAKKQVEGTVAKELADTYEKKAQEALKNGDTTNAELNEHIAKQYRAKVQDLASWQEGGSNKIALHALVGGMMSALGESGFASGAVGAGVNEALQNELSKIKDPDAHQWASALIGAAAASVVNGSVQAGASTAASGTKNNILGEEYINEMVDWIINKCKPGIKDNINNLIEEGLLSSPNEMTHDYRIIMNGASLPIKFVGGACGYILDRKGNVYGLIEADGGFALSTPVQVTDGFGDFNAPKENREDYQSAIEGWSLGGGGAAGLQVTASVSTSGVVSSEVTGTTAIGTTLFAGRYVKYLFNLNDD